MNQHEGHHITYNEECIIPYDFTVTDKGDIVLNEKTRDVDIVDTFYWCNTCHEYCYSDEFGAKTHPQIT